MKVASSEYQKNLLGALGEIYINSLATKEDIETVLDSSWEDIAEFVEEKTKIVVRNGADYVYDVRAKDDLYSQLMSE